MNPLLLALRAYRSSVEIHKHSAYQLVLAEMGSFDTMIEGVHYKSIQGFAIKPQVAHSCQSPNSNVVILNLEPYSWVGKFLSEKFEVGKSVVVFYSQEEINRFFNTTFNNIAIANLMKGGNGQALFSIMDERVKKIVDYIHENYTSNKFTLDNLSDIVYLSPSRLAALFKEQMGSSISKYLLWTRLKQAIFLILEKNDKSFTTIAQECGFYDSSQMNKYMYEMFGLSPSRLKQKSDLIQFLD